MGKRNIDKLFVENINPDSDRSLFNEHWLQARALLRKRRRRRFFFFWMLGAPLSLGAYLLYLQIASGLAPTNMINNDHIDKQEESPVEKAHITSFNEFDSAISWEVLKNKDKEPIDKNNWPLYVEESFPEKVKKNKAKLIEKAPKDKRDVQSTLIVHEDPWTLAKSLDAKIEEEYAENTSKVRSHELLSGLSSNHLSTLSYVYALEDGEYKEGISVERFNRSRFGWSGTVLLNPSEAGVLSTGLILGFTYEKYLSKAFFVGLRPSVQTRSEKDGFSKIGDVTTFSFEARNTTYGLKTENLQFVSLPLYLGFEQGKHTAEGGVSFDFLLTARGALQKIDIEGHQINTIQTVNAGWIKTDDMQRFSSNVFAGYKFAFSPNLKTGFNIFFNPGKIFPTLPSSNLQSIHNKWIIGWQATYYLR